MRLIDKNRSGDIVVSEFKEEDLHELICGDSKILKNADNVSVLFLDVETTGLSYENDKIIQLAVRPVLFDKNSNSITRLAKAKVFYNDPGEKISDEIVALTGVTNEAVADHKIPWDSVSNLISKVDFVVAHNVRFDRHFVRKHMIKADIAMPDTIWACSMSQVNWRSTCTAGKSLETLSAWHGFYYQAHSADIDVAATIYLLQKSGFMNELLTTALKSQYRVFAVDLPFSNKDEIKSRKYQWDNDVRVWWHGFPEKADAEAESEWLATNYKIKPQIFEVKACHLFD